MNTLVDKRDLARAKQLYAEANLNNPLAKGWAQLQSHEQAIYLDKAEGEREISSRLFVETGDDPRQSAFERNAATVSERPIMDPRFSGLDAEVRGSWQMVEHKCVFDFNDVRQAGLEGWSMCGVQPADRQIGAPAIFYLRR